MKLKAVSLLLSSLFIAAAAQGADLLQIYKEALDNDAQFTAAKHTLEAGREKLPQGRAGLLPTLGVSVNTMWNDV